MGWRNWSVRFSIKNDSGFTLRRQAWNYSFYTHDFSKPGQDPYFGHYDPSSIQTLNNQAGVSPLIEIADKTEHLFGVDLEFSTGPTDSGKREWQEVRGCLGFEAKEAIAPGNVLRVRWRRDWPPKRPSLSFAVDAAGVFDCSPSGFKNVVTVGPNDTVSITVLKRPPKIVAAPSNSNAYLPQKSPCSSCVLGSAADWGKCMIHVIDNYIGPPGVLRPVPGFTSVGGATSCPDALKSMLRNWGAKAPFAYNVPLDQKPGNGTMPGRGDAFLLVFNKPKEVRPGEWVPKGASAHVGIVYDVRGDASNFEWRSAEGGQAENKMWINPNWRGVTGKETDLAGWKTVSSIPRDINRCNQGKGK